MNHLSPMAFSCNKLKYVARRTFALATGRKNFHLVHIGKTGGTAMKEAMAKQLITKSHVIHLHPHRIRLPQIPDNHQFGFVIRCPISRYISGFLSRQRQGAPAHHVPWSDAEQLAFKTFQTPHDLALALDSRSPLHQEALQAMKAITHIQRRYSYWFIDEQTFKSRQDSILFIGRIESLVDDFEILKGRLHLPASITLPLGEKAANRSTEKSDTKHDLEPRAKRLLENWYERDFEFIHQCEEWIDQQGGPVKAI